MNRIISSQYKNIVGAQIRELRESCNLSQQQLSQKLETEGVYVCRGSISRIEARARTVSDIELFCIAKHLGVTVQDLFNGIQSLDELNSLQK